MFGPLGLIYGLLVPIYLVAQLGNGGERARGRRRTEAPPVPTVVGRRSFAGNELRSTILKSEGMGRERNVARFRSGDSGHGRGAGRWSAPSSHSRGHGSSWGGFAWALRGKGSARSMLSRVWGCSPCKESDQYGLVEEIDGEALFSLKNRGGEIGAGGRQAGRFSELGMVAESSLGCLL